MNNPRRQFLCAGMALGVTGLTSDLYSTFAAERKDADQVDVSPAEDLMREHGVLKRILLIYDEAIRRLDANEDLPPKPIADAAGIIRSFIEDYHEKLEEDFLFPRFKRADKLVDLASVLLQQHQVGRQLTNTVLRLSAAKAFKSREEKHSLAEPMRLFVRMYGPHAAREDTVLFPAFREIVSGEEYGAMGDNFERREHELFGNHGFTNVVTRVAVIENTLGIFDLSRFTAHM